MTLLASHLWISLVHAIHLKYDVIFGINLTARLFKNIIYKSYWRNYKLYIPIDLVEYVFEFQFCHL